MRAALGNDFHSAHVLDERQPGGGRSEMDGKRFSRLLVIARLAVCGAVLGAAAVGTLFPNAASLSAVGAFAGFAAVLAVKIAHII